MIGSMPIHITGSYRLKKPKKKAIAPILPGDKFLLKQIEEEHERKRQNAKTQPKLQNLGPAEIKWQLKNPPKNLPDILGVIVERMWAEIPEKGLHNSLMAQVASFRSNIPPLVTVSQLYGMYPSSTTLVDRLIRLAQSRGTVRLLQVNIDDASDLLVNSENYYKELDDSVLEQQVFKNLLKSRSDAVWLSTDDLHDADLSQAQVSKLVTAGFLTIDPSRPGVHTISLPRQGAFIRLILSSRKWLQKALAATKWKELPESQLEEKLETTVNFWKEFKGVTLEWILYDGVGAGLVAAFGSPVGMGWKLVRK